MSSDNPCLRCGACCAFFRVSFYWGEADPAVPGSVPVELTEPLNPYRSVMLGTRCAPTRCIALQGEIGDDARCTIYTQRPGPCRELEPWQPDGEPDEKCARARQHHNLPPLVRRLQLTPNAQ
jgi:uncharacterized protein